LVRASGKLLKRGLTEIHDVEQKAVRAVRVQVRRTVVHGVVVMGMSGKLERDGGWGGDSGELLTRVAREATVEAVAEGAVHLKGLPMVKDKAV
jgi:hypothetical protein